MKQRHPSRMRLSDVPGNPAQQLELFALVNLGLVQSLASGILSPDEAVKRFYHADNCLYLQRHFRRREANTIMSRGVQLPDIFECLPPEVRIEQLLVRARTRRWKVYAKPPFGGPRQVLKYLARYTHRVAISNQRLVSLENGRVTFRWKNYAHAGEPATMTLKAEEFIRRFLLHVLPKGFVKARHFGFQANRGRRDKVLLCRKLLAASSTTPPGVVPHDLHSKGPEVDTVDRCPHCKVGSMRMLEILVPQADAIAQPGSP